MTVLKKTSLRTHFYAVIILTAVILSAVTVFTSNLLYRASQHSRCENVSRTVAQTVSSFVKNSDLQGYVNGMNSVEYIETNNKIRRLAKSVPDIVCIDLYNMTENGMQTVFDTQSDDIKGGLGKVYDYDRNWAKYKSEFLTGENVSDAQILISEGMAVMYCVPFEKNDDGYTYICVGITQSKLTAERMRFMKYTSLIIILTACVTVICSLWIFRRRVTKPLKKIMLLTERAATENDEALIYDILNTNVNVSNELENIYKSLLKIYTSKTRLMSAASAADEKSVKAIISLIKRMDNFTALHLDNSLQYVILIVNELRKTDKYKSIISEDDLRDLIFAAPLHDIGKLAVPKSIVDKPARLTDEEYEIMKKHSTLGAMIIDEAFLKNSDESYLQLAREIALYHHERWDGGGYPEGISGEDIPIAVRIVSIADVFDALVSKRSYKEAYSFDKSFDIIVSESGKFFDPDIIDVLIGAKSKMRKIYNRIKA